MIGFQMDVGWLVADGFIRQYKRTVRGGSTGGVGRGGKFKTLEV